MKLTFQASSGKERKIADVDNQEEAMREIKKFCYEHEFKIPYTRFYGSLDNDGIWIDVGSWSEKFHLTK